MSRFVNRLVLERLTSLELLLMQSFDREARDRLTRYASRIRSTGGVVSGLTNNREQDSDSAGTCLGGLEVEVVSGSTVQVTGGALFGHRTTGPSLFIRPGSWSGRVDPDDDTYGSVFTLSESTTNTFAPSVPISGALGAYEWWTVYAQMPFTDVTVESDSLRRTYDWATGGWDAGITPKVTERQLTIVVQRGASGTPLGSGTPLSNAYPIAYLYVPAGATSLTSAIVFDARKVRSSPGENVIGGAWRISTTGGNGNSTTCGYYAFKGSVWARLNGEMLGYRTPVATYISNFLDGTSNFGGPSSSTPGVVYFYLAKVQGVVPRMKAFGTAPVGDATVAASTSATYEGMLVMSAVPPRLINGTQTSERRWDLRSSASMQVQYLVNGGTTASLVVNSTVAAGDAICVGMAYYTATDSAGLPLLNGNYFYDTDGWVTGEGVTNTASGLFGSGPAATSSSSTATASATPPWASLGVVVTNSSRTFSISVSPPNVTVGTRSLGLPIRQYKLGLDLQVTVASGTVTGNVNLFGEGQGETAVIPPTGEVVLHPKLVVSTPNGIPETLAGSHGVVAPASASTTVFVAVHGFRLPYDEPLHTSSL